MLHNHSWLTQLGILGIGLEFQYVKFMCLCPSTIDGCSHLLKRAINFVQKLFLASIFGFNCDLIITLTALDKL